jgi:hypothetical protein
VPIPIPISAPAAEAWEKMRELERGGRDGNEMRFMRVQNCYTFVVHIHSHMTEFVRVLVILLNLM